MKIRFHQIVKCFRNMGKGKKNWKYHHVINSLYGMKVHKMVQDGKVK